MNRQNRNRTAGVAADVSNLFCCNFFFLVMTPSFSSKGCEPSLNFLKLSVEKLQAKSNEPVNEND